MTIPAMAPPDRPLELLPLLACRPGVPVADVPGFGLADWRPGTSTTVTEVMGPPSTEEGTELAEEEVSATDEEGSVDEDGGGASDDSVLEGAAEDEGASEVEGSALEVGTADEVDEGGASDEVGSALLGSGSVDDDVGCWLDEELEVGSAEEVGSSEDCGGFEVVGSADEEGSGEGSLELVGATLGSAELGSTGGEEVEASRPSDPVLDEVKLGVELPSAPAPSAVSPVIPDRKSVV